jgi:hypothetical protein
MSRRVKAGHTGSRRDTDISGRALREFEEAQRRREAWAQQQATREQLEQAARRQGWKVTETKEQR